MAKMVGFSRNIKLQWVKKAIELVGRNLSEVEFKQEMNEYLSFEIESPTNLRKTREILMNIWFYDSDDITPFRKEGLKLIEKYPDYLVPVTLCLTYLTYPVFADICKFMGRIFEYHDEINNTIIKQKLFDEWGERGTLDSICSRVTLTLKDYGILTSEKANRYKLNKSNITRNEVVAFLLATAMKLDGNSYYTFAELKEFDVLFPYEFTISKEQLLTDQHFTLTHFGGEMTIALKESN